QLHETFRLHPAATDEARWDRLSRACIGFDTMPGYESIFAGTLADGLEKGLRTDIYAAAVWQAASDTLPGAQSTIGAGRLNLRADALLFRNEGEGMGRFTAQVHLNGVLPNLSDSITASTGSITDLDELQSRHASSLTRLGYTQSFLDNHVMLSAGKINPNDFVLANIFANDESKQFLAQPFDGNSTWPVSFQDHSMGVGLLSLPADWCFLNGFIVDAAGTQSAWLGDEFGAGLAVSGEFGLLAEIEGLPARLSFAWCGTNANAVTIAAGDSGDGLWGNAYGSIAQLLLQPKFALWAQWSACDASVASNATQEVAFGMTIDDCFGRAGDGFGAAIGWSKPKDAGSADDLDDQVLLECFYRLEITKGVQISLDGQVLMPCANPGIDDPTVIGSMRAMWEF
ncbi:MAG: carbohydrate porin, partial [bacterium]